ncbi:MAG: NAD(P)H-dependent oxidoreductase subunit E [Flexilinea sp.]
MREISLDEVKAFTYGVLERHAYNKSEVITMLQEVQGEYHYLPEVALISFAEGLKVPAQTIYGVATFYAQFSLDPKGKYLVQICNGTACHVRNSMLIHDAVIKKLDLKNDQKTTKDGLFTLETVACLGACSIGPVMVINDTIYPQMNPEAALGIIETLYNRKNEKQEA